MRRIRRIVFYLFLAVFTLTAAGILSVILYRDQIIHHFIREANQYIETPVHTDRPVISFAKFPEVAILFYNVFIEESFAGSKAPLAKIDRLYVAFNPFDLLFGNYSVRDITAVNGEINLKLNNRGENNYTVFKKSGSDTSGVSFSLKSIQMVNVALNYQNIARKSEHKFDLEDMMVSLEGEGSQYTVELDGDFRTMYIRIREQDYFKNKSFSIESSILYEGHSSKITFQSTTLSLDNSDFNIEGFYAYSDVEEISLGVEAEQADVQTLLSMLPLESYDKLKKYRSEGNVYFSASITGTWEENETPSVIINFGSDDASIYHPNYNTRLEALSFRGYFSSPSINGFDKAQLLISGFESKINGNPIRGSLEMTQLGNTFLKTRLNGKFSVQDVFEFYPFEKMTGGNGSINFNVYFEGRPDDLKSKHTSRNVKSEGTVDLENVSLGLADYNLPLKDLHGKFVFNNNDLEITNFKGQLGNSDFLLNGLFRNIISFLLSQDQPIGIEADLQSTFIDIDELLSGTAVARENDKGYHFSIDPLLFLSFNCNIEHLNFRRFEPRNIVGELKVKDQLALGRNLTADALGGKITLTGLVDARKDQDISVEIESDLKHINIDEIFYVFENFNQDWLVDENLKGQLTASIIASMAFNERLHFKSDRLVSDISTTIQNGELNNFEPMQELSRYVEDNDLSQLSFSDIANDIHVENRTIYLPEMEVRSNVTNIKISGTHTFSQDIDYRVIVPLKTWLSERSDPAFGAVEEDEFGRSKLYLRIIGNTSDYRIIYDKESVKKKVVADLKKEVEELKDAFKNKGKEEEETVGLNEDEYFEWDDN